MYIKPQTWTNIKQGNARRGAQCVPEELVQIRQNSRIQTLMQEHPIVEQWLPKPYTEDEVAIVLRNLKNKKSMGADGIPGESVQSTKNHNN